MRKALFDVTGRLGHLLVEINKNVAIALIRLVQFFSNAGFALTHFTVQALLRLIDKQRFTLLQAYQDQKDMHLELDVIASVVKVKEHALTEKKWTSHHTQALEILGSRLVNDCDWSERKMHVYMKSVVESIPGLQYMVDIDQYYDEDDDDDEEAITIE